MQKANCVCFEKETIWGQEYSSVVEWILGMCKTLGSIAKSIKKKE